MGSKCIYPAAQLWRWKKYKKNLQNHESPTDHSVGLVSFSLRYCKLKVYHQ